MERVTDDVRSRTGVPPWLAGARYAAVGAVLALGGLAMHATVGRAATPVGVPGAVGAIHVTAAHAGAHPQPLTPAPGTGAGQSADGLRLVTLSVNLDPTGDGSVVDPRRFTLDAGAGPVPPQLTSPAGARPTGPPLAWMLVFAVPAAAVGGVLRFAAGTATPVTLPAPGATHAAPPPQHPPARPPAPGPTGKKVSR